MELAGHLNQAVSQIAKWPHSWFESTQSSKPFQSRGRPSRTTQPSTHLQQQPHQHTVDAKPKIRPDDVDDRKENPGLALVHLIRKEDECSLRGDEIHFAILDSLDTEGLEFLAQRPKLPRRLRASWASGQEIAPAAVRSQFWWLNQ